MDNRIELLASTIHDLSATGREAFGLARIVSDIVRLTFPDCPPEVIAHAVRYSDAVRHAFTLGAAWGSIPGGTARSHALRELTVEAERDADARCMAFVQSVQDHQFLSTVQLPAPADCDPLTGIEYGTAS